MDFRDYYATLGVPKTASAKEIKQAFRRLARKHHPDVNPGDRGAEAKFKEVNEAYEVLGNADTRKKYDELGANWRQYEQAGQPPWGAGGGGRVHQMTPEEVAAIFGESGSPFSDFFNTFFGGLPRSEGARARRGPSPRGRRAPEIEHELPLELESALGGRTERISVHGPAGPKTLEVRIPAGVTDGSRLKAGDVFLRVRLVPHPRFERAGRDLTTTVVVSVTTAALGGPVEVATLSGSRLTMKVPPGTQPGQRLRLKGHGLPAPGAPDDRGDLFARVEVRVPTALSDDARRHYEALRALESKSQ